MGIKKPRLDNAGRQIRWLTFANSIYAVAVIFTLCLGTFGSFSLSQYEEQLEDAIGRPSLFALRTALSLAPRLDPRIKVIAYDDDTVATLGRPEILGPDIWLELVNAVEKRGPKTILFDRVFANKSPTTLQVLETISIFKRPVPVASGALLTRGDISGWTEVKQQMNFASSDEFAKQYAHVFSGLHAYGPAADFASATEHVGHLSYRSPGWFAPMVAFKNGATLPHLSLLTSNKIEFDGPQLRVNGQNTPLNHQAEALINWSPKEDYFNISYSLLNILNRSRMGQELSAIQKNDIVVILPQMYTGSTDFKGTMIGPIPGGYSQVAAVNMVLTDKWLKVIQSGLFGVLLACLIGALTSFWRRTIARVSFILATNIIFATAVVTLFCYGSISVNWIAPLCAFNVCSMVIFIVRSTSDEILALRVEDALTGVVSPSILARIKNDPSKFAVVPKEIELTVVFVDFVGFSASAETVVPKALFDYLKTELGMMATLIHHYGGIVDKTLGDGLMGFFGYDPLTEETSENHPDQALHCAAAIQLALAQRCVNPSSYDAPFFPARIGINTGPAYVGDLGENGKIDLTLIGHTVNLAKRLEDASQPFKVLIGPKTKTSLADPKLQNQLALCKVSVKHQTHLFDAFEFDPFENDPDLYTGASKKVRERAELERLEDRYTIVPHQNWEIWSQGIKIGQCVDFSASGCCLDLNVLLANRVSLTFDFKVFEKNIMGDEKSICMIRDVAAKVCWSKSSGEFYRHGVLFSDETIRRLKAEPIRPVELAQNKYFRAA